MTLLIKKDSMKTFMVKPKEHKRVSSAANLRNFKEEKKTEPSK